MLKITNKVIYSTFPKITNIAVTDINTLNTSHVIQSPFNNCQIFSASNIEKTAITNRTLKQSIEIFKEIQKCYNRNVLQIDIKNKEENHKRIIEVFGSDNVMSRADYINTTGSMMTSYILNTINIR